MNRKNAILISSTLLFIVAVFGLIIFNSKNKAIVIGNNTNNIISKATDQPVNLNKNAAQNNNVELTLFSGAVLIGMRNDNDGITRLSYETSRGNVIKYYQDELNKKEWKKIDDLKTEDFTDCGGDWGGTYEKSGKKIKIHVCGDDQEGWSKNISLSFLNNLNPADILGKTFITDETNCVTDGEITSINACDTGTSIKFKITMKTDRINNFRANLGSYAWKEAYNIHNNKGAVNFETPYEKGWEWAIKEASVYPVVKSGTNNYDCSFARKEVKINKCE